MVCRCGFEADLRATVHQLTDSALDLHIDAVIADAMLLDVNGDDKLQKEEFMAWGKKNRHVGRWIDNLSRFIVSSLGDLSIAEFNPDLDWGD